MNQIEKEQRARRLRERLKAIAGSAAPHEQEEAEHIRLELADLMNTTLNTLNTLARIRVEQSSGRPHLDVVTAETYPVSLQLPVSRWTVESDVVASERYLILRIPMSQVDIVGPGAPRPWECGCEGCDQAAEQGRARAAKP